MQSVFHQLAERVLAGGEITNEEAELVLNCPDYQILDVLSAAYEIRRKYFSNKVKLNMIINTKSGLCPEDCGYCAQSIVSTAPIEKYSMMKKEEIVATAKRAVELQVGTYCIVASGRGPTNREIDIVTQSVKEIKGQYADLKVCACLGILKDGQAELLKEAGVDRYNHNINTSENHHGNITTTHTFNDRVATIERVKDAHISPCSGVIIGMEETMDDVITMARKMKELQVDSIPINFFHPVEGTPLAKESTLQPLYCLKVLCLFRFINPTREIRIAGGREVNMRSLQPLGLYPANSIFVGDYLTTEGQSQSDDIKMLKDAGFEVEQLVKRA